MHFTNTTVYQIFSYFFRRRNLIVQLHKTFYIESTARLGEIVVFIHYSNKARIKVLFLALTKCILHFFGRAFTYQYDAEINQVGGT